jgi:hypothetical protein
MEREPNDSNLAWVEVVRTTHCVGVVMRHGSRAGQIAAIWMRVRGDRILSRIFLTTLPAATQSD